MRFEIAPPKARDEPWALQAFAYSYVLFRDNREIIACHWDHEAAGSNAVRTPHLHIGKELPHPAMHPSDRDHLNVLASAHWPTGPVPLTAFLRAAIQDLGVEPIRWQEESAEEARTAVERSFAEAEAILLESFAWRRS